MDVYNPRRREREMPYAVSCVGVYSTVGILKLKYHIRLNLKVLSS